MPDEEFIDKLNDIIFDYGYIVIIKENIDYYIKKYNLTIDIHFNYVDNIKYNSFFIYNMTRKTVIISFPSIYKMLNGGGRTWSLFEYVNFTKNYTNMRLTERFNEFILSVEGSSKEEVCLKIQMMGY